MNQIKLLVLDAHGVVLTNPLHDFLDRLADLTGQAREVVRTRWRRELRVPAWTGGIDDGELWRELSGERNGCDWRGMLEQAYDVGPAAPHLARWSERVPLWMLSNHRSHWLKPRLRRFDVDAVFERVLVSDRIGWAKPEAAAFVPILDHVSPASVLFLDDRKRNVETARRLGLNAVRVDQNEAWVAAVDRYLAR